MISEQMYDRTTERLVTPVEQRFGRTIGRLAAAVRNIGVQDLGIEVGTADRSRFLLHPVDVLSGNVEIEIVEDIEDADIVAKVSNRAINSIKVGDDGLVDLEATGDDAASILCTKREEVLHREYEKHAWWNVYGNKSYYEDNPFKSDPTEQFIIGPEDEPQVVVYNFGRPLPPRNVRDIVGGVEIFGQSTHNHSKELVSTIVVHNEFKRKYFKATKTFGKPSGRAWLGKPFIEVNRSSLSGMKGSVGQSWVEQLIAHEKKHQFDFDLDERRDVMEDFFVYHDDNRDRIIDRIVPSASHDWSAHSDETIKSSKPHRQYAYTDPAEDLAVAAEEGAFGGDMDPMRRDAMLHILEDYVRKACGDPEATLSWPLSAKRTIPVQRLTAGDINLPQIASLNRPVRILIQKSLRSSSNSKMRRVIDRLFQRDNTELAA